MAKVEDRALAPNAGLNDDIGEERRLRMYRLQVEIREADVNFSAWDCTLEPGANDKHAVRLGFRLIQGLGEDELKAAKKALGWPTDEKFYLPPEAVDFFRRAVDAGADEESKIN